MPDANVFPTPRDRPRNIESYALHGAFSVGDLTIHHVTDGLGFGNRRYWFNGIDPRVWMRPLGLSDPDTPFPVNYGLFVIVGPDRTTLVDTGFGPASNEIPGLRAANELLWRLAEIGVAPEAVDDVVLTHMHTDHCGNLVTEEDATTRITFPNATVHLHADELRYWTSAESDDNPMTPYTRLRIEPVLASGQVQTFTSTVAVTDSVTAIAMTGHTAGHSVVRVADGGVVCYLVGDLAHHPVQFCHHSWLSAYDMQPPQSIRSRAALAERAIAENAIVTAPHMPILTLGRLGRAEDGALTWTAVAAP